MGRVHAYVVGGALLALTVEPVLHAEPRDSFPFSHYPMFASPRRADASQVVHAVAIDASGAARPVPPRVLGTEEVLQATVIVARAVRNGPAAARELCEALAGRVGSQPDLAGAASIELRTDAFDAIAYFRGDTAPRSSRVHARCRVAR